MQRLFTLLAMITHPSVQSSTWTLFTLLAMITHPSVQSSTWTLFTLLVMITHPSVQSSTWTVFTLLVMITHPSVQSSTRTPFTILFCLQNPQQCLIQQSSFPIWQALNDMGLQKVKSDHHRPPKACKRDQEKKTANNNFVGSMFLGIPKIVFT